MNSPKILLIEDDDGIITPLSLYLEQSNFEVVVCKDGGDALDIFRMEKPNIIILDINLPGKNWIEVCREIRGVSGVPILMLSARESEDDKVTLLELGADDYVSKPFSPRELVARVHAIIKRSEIKKEVKNNNKCLTFGDISVDTKNFIATINGIELRLTKTEFGILEYFIKNAKTVIKRDSLMKDIMWYDQYIYDRTIDTHVKNLRKKLGESMQIETIRGIGYRIG